jgi:hypothetical protein
MISRQEFGHLNVVVVDDNKDVRSALGGYFASSGAIARVCQNARRSPQDNSVAPPFTPRDLVKVVTGLDL